MASIYKHSSDKWIAVIRRTGFKTRTKSFTKHSDAKQWALAQESQIAQQKEHGIKHSLHEALNIYLSEFVPSYKN